MNKGFPCFEYSEIGPKGQNRIDYCFVAGDEEIASHVRISLGDPDPMTGEIIADRMLFREYHRMRNREIYGNKKAVVPPLSSREKEARRNLQEQIAECFMRDFGYAPDKGTLKWLMAEKAPKAYRLELDSCVSEDGISWADCVAAFADPSAEEAFREAENDGEDLLETFAETLDDRELEMFRLLQMKADGCNMHGMICHLAQKWGIDQSGVSRMKTRIGRRFQEFVKEED